MAEQLVRIGAAEILPLKTLTVPPYTSTNTVAYGHRSFVVIDPGCHTKEEQAILEAYIASRIKKGEQFLGICLTHHHGDHVRAAPFLSKQFGVPIWAHENAQKHLDFKVDRELKDSETLFIEEGLALKVLYTPGHTDDHLVFFDELNGIVIAGDMITDRGTVLIPPENGSLKHYLKSLEALIKLPITALIPAHGRVLTKEPKIFLKNAFDHRVQRIISVLDALIESDTSLEVEAITLKIYKNLIPSDLLVFAQLSVESSLNWLLEHFLVQKVDCKWHAVPNAHELKKAFLAT